MLHFAHGGSVVISCTLLCSGRFQLCCRHINAGTCTGDKFIRCTDYGKGNTCDRTASDLSQLIFVLCSITRCGWSSSDADLNRMESPLQPGHAVNSVAVIATAVVPLLYIFSTLFSPSCTAGRWFITSHEALLTMLESRAIKTHARADCF